MKEKRRRGEEKPFGGGREGWENEWLLLWFSRKVEIIKELWRWHVKSIYKESPAGHNRTSRTGIRHP